MPCIYLETKIRSRSNVKVESYTYPEDLQGRKVMFHNANPPFQSVHTQALVESGLRSQLHMYLGERDSSQVGSAFNHGFQRMGHSVRSTIH